MSKEALKLFDGYMEMAATALYRPGAPSDGIGHIEMTEEELENPSILDAEAIAYVKQFIAEEDTHRFRIGVSNLSTAQAFMWTIEAARCLAGCRDDVALKLLKMAIDEVSAAPESGVALYLKRRLKTDD